MQTTRAFLGRGQIAERRKQARHLTKEAIAFSTELGGLGLIDSHMCRFIDCEEVEELAS